MNLSTFLPRRNLLKSLAGLVALASATRADDREAPPFSWTITDQLGQRMRFEVYLHRPTAEQAREWPVWADRTGRAFLVASDAPAEPVTRTVGGHSS